MTSLASDASDSRSSASSLFGARARQGVVASAAAAAWLGWLPFALVDQAFVSRVKIWTKPEYRVVQHHVYELGLALAMGALMAMFVWGYGRLRHFALPRLSPRWAMVLDALVVSFFFFWLGMRMMRPDLETFAGRKAKAWHQSPELIRVGFQIGLGLGFGAALTFGRLVARRRWRWLGVALAVALAVVNFEVLFGDYWTLHSAMAMFSAVLAGASLLGARLPASLRLPSRIERGFLGLLVLVAAWAAIFPPAPGLAFRVLATRCSPFTPILGFRGYHGTEAAAVVPPEQGEWFSPRDSHPPVKSSLPDDAPRDQIVIMMTIDAFRGDVLESGAHDDVLPELTRMKRESVHFENAISPSSQTVYTMTSWFSGKFFSQLYWSRKGRGQFWPSRDRTKRVPGLLHDAGIESTYVMAANWLTRSTGLVGGFTHYDSLQKGKKSKDYARASATSKDLLERLSAVQPGQPYFIFAHFMDAHLPYKGFKRKKVPFENYVKEIAIVDTELGKLRQRIKELGIEDRTTLIVSADHGEAFGAGDHGVYQHGVSVYQELIHVPLMIVGPGVEPRSIKNYVSTLDLGPTILDIFGLDTPGTMMGQSLVGVLHGGELDSTRPIVSENRLRATMIFPDGIKVSRDLHLGSGEAYDLNTDSLELKNRVDDPTLDTGNKFALLQQYFRAHTLKRHRYTPPYRR